MPGKASRSDVEWLQRPDGTWGSIGASWPAIVQAAGELQTSDSVQQARMRARDVARRYGCDDERAHRFELAVHEVCANAVAHAGGGYYGVWCKPDELVCEVVDAGPGMSEPVRGRGPPEVSSEGGYGLWLTRQMCERVEIGSRPGWTTVRLYVALS